MSDNAQEVLKLAGLDNWGDESNAIHLRGARRISKVAWSNYGGVIRAAGEVAEMMPAGQYEVGVDQQGLYFSSLNVQTDDLILLKDSVSDRVITEINRFWLMSKHFAEYGFVWKRGVLLPGPPGSGKTATVQMIAQAVVANDGIALFGSNPKIVARGLKIIRGIEPYRPIVVMFEDIDAIIEEYGDSDLLAMLDGELQIDRVVFVATTNYLSNLADRFTKRPSRFDLVVKVNMPSDDVRRAFLSNKVKDLSDEELNVWVEKTKGFGIAHLKELIIAVRIFQYDMEETLAKLRKSLPKDENGDEEEEENETSSKEELEDKPVKKRKKRSSKK